MNLEPQSANTRRGIYLLPNLLTTGCLFFGFYAIVAAIENALEPWGIVINDYPVEPQRICELLDEAEASGAKVA